MQGLCGFGRILPAVEAALQLDREACVRPERRQDRGAVLRCQPQKEQSRRLAVLWASRRGARVRGLGSWVQGSQRRDACTQKAYQAQAQGAEEGGDGTGRLAVKRLESHRLLVVGKVWQDVCRSCRSIKRRPVWRPRRQRLLDATRPATPLSKGNVSSNVAKRA